MKSLRFVSLPCLITVNRQLKILLRNPSSHPVLLMSLVYYPLGGLCCNLSIVISMVQGTFIQGFVFKRISKRSIKMLDCVWRSCFEKVHGERRQTSVWQGMHVTPVELFKLFKWCMYEKMLSFWIHSLGKWQLDRRIRTDFNINLRGACENAMT